MYAVNGQGKKQTFSRTSHHAHLGQTFNRRVLIVRAMVLRLNTVTEILYITVTASELMTGIEIQWE